MYRTVDTAIWTDPKMKGLTDDAFWVFVYLITNPHTHVSGIYYIPDAVICHEARITKARLDRVWHTLSDARIAYRDTVYEVVWVRKMFDRQGRGAKNNSSAAEQLKTLHNSPLIKDFLQFYEHRKIPYRYPIPENSNQEQDQEQDQEQEQEQEQESEGTHAKSGRFIPPTPEEVSAYCEEHGYKIDPTAFVDHYAARGWVPKGYTRQMRDWKAAVRTWARYDKKFSGSQADDRDPDAELAAARRRLSEEFAKK